MQVLTVLCSTKKKKKKPNKKPKWVNKIPLEDHPELLAYIIEVF